MSVQTLRVQGAYGVQGAYDVLGTPSGLEVVLGTDCITYRISPIEETTDSESRMLQST